MAGNGPAGGPRPGGRLLLRARRGAGGVRPGPEDRRESGEDDQQPHPAALSVLLAEVLLSQEWHSHLQVRESGRGVARRPNRQYAVRGADESAGQLPPAVQPEGPAAHLEQGGLRSGGGAHPARVLRAPARGQPAGGHAHRQRQQSRGSDLRARL